MFKKAVVGNSYVVLVARVCFAEEGTKQAVHKFFLQMSLHYSLILPLIT